MESIAPLLPKTDDPGFTNILGGGPSILELQTSATLQELGAGQTLNSMPSIPSRFQQSPSDVLYTPFLHLFIPGHSPFSDEVSQSTFHWSSVYGTKPLYPALGYDHHPDHFSASNESSVLPSTTISVTTSEDKLNSKTLVNSEPRFSMMGSQTCSISMETNDLRQYIKKRQKLGINCPFSVSEEINLMFQIAEAMRYMHSDQRIAHRDLKAANILVVKVHAPELFQEEFVIAKLADFGMAEMRREVTAYSHMTPKQGTRPWMAPEELGANEGEEERLLVACPFKTDLYTSEIICLEILTAVTSFQNITLSGQHKPLMDSLQPSRPVLPENCPESLASLIRMCWHTDPRRRPTFAEICTTLRYLKDDLLLMRGYEKLSDLSEDYAESKYRLDVVGMLRTYGLVLPVFYDAESGPYAEAFEKQKSKKPTEKVNERADTRRSLSWLDYKWSRSTAIMEIIAKNMSTFSDLKDAYTSLAGVIKKLQKLYLILAEDLIKAVQKLDGAGASCGVHRVQWLDTTFAKKVMYNYVNCNLKPQIMVVRAFKSSGFDDWPHRLLVDFGVSKLNSLGTTLRTSCCLEAADIYSFGISCLEIILSVRTPRVDIWETPLYSRAFYEKLRKYLEHAYELSGEDHPTRSLLQAKRSTRKLLAGLNGHMGTENNRETSGKASVRGGSSGTDVEEIMTCQKFTDVVGVVSPQRLMHSAYGTNELRSQTGYDKGNVDTKLKGGSAAAQVTEIRTTQPKLTEDGETTTALEALHMVGIAKPLELHEFEPARKRIRTRDWSAEEIRTMLEIVEGTLRMDMGPDIWGYVSDTLWENYGFDRASNSCENLWGTLLQSHKASRDRGDTGASTGFELEFRETIERILPRLPLEGNRNFQMNLGSGLPSSALPLRQFRSSASETGFPDSAGCEEALSDAEMDEVDTHSDGEVLSGDSTATIESQAEVSHVSRTTEPWDETNSNYCRKRSAARVAEEDLISKIAPFVNRQIEDALKPLLSVLRKREEEQQKHREKLLALEQEKLALKREKMHFTHRVVDQQSGSCTPLFSSELRQKKPIL